MTIEEAERSLIGRENGQEVRPEAAHALNLHVLSEDQWSTPLLENLPSTPPPAPAQRSRQISFEEAEDNLMSGREDPEVNSEEAELWFSNLPTDDIVRRRVCCCTLDMTNTGSAYKTAQPLQTGHGRSLTTRTRPNH